MRWRLVGEEGIECALNLIDGVGAAIVIAAQVQIFLLFAFQLAAQRSADQAVAGGARRKRHHRAVIDGRLARELRERVGDAAPVTRLLRQRQRVDAVVGQRRQHGVELGAGDDHRHRRCATAPC